MLVYGTDAVIPAEVEIPSLRVIQEAKLDDTECIWFRQEQLMLIDEKRMDAVCHDQLYQNRMANAINKRVKPLQFTPGQLVLKKIFPHQEEAKGKLVLNWQGPYVVHRVLLGGDLILAEMDERLTGMIVFSFKSIAPIKRRYFTFSVQRSPNKPLAFYKSIAPIKRRYFTF
ncbi:PREDICTED: uncharacterized protein LOC109214070 [Nicotiana attenuata]|uniref:uncharacterized protein LOC109214070 n=1 Tax=Nicotiana attenuata TaxID=49451 RepID=UPI000904E915|nr:PREDICTED: uncharacterized protein LOC109214070 [Nicotiana attenuata]